MKEISLKVISLFLLVININSCSSTKTRYDKAKLYRDEDAIYKSSFSNDEIDGIKNYLTLATKENIKDTIIIKYDFNNETCWNALDEKPNKYIKGIIDARNEAIEAYKLAHKNTSVFHFKEQGSNMNKIILNDKNVYIDNGYLRKNIFPNTAICGSSIIIYPNKRYKIIYSDSHFKALDK